MARRDWMSQLFGVGLLTLSGLGLIGLGLLWVHGEPGGNVIVATRKGAFAPAFVVCVGAVLVVLALVLLLASVRERLAVWRFTRRPSRARGRSR
jgi:plastocyanin domain-containing protein